LTHLLPDRPELLDAFNAVCPIALVIGIPYSTVPDVLAEVRKKYPVATPTLDELLTPQFMTDLVGSVFVANPDVKLAIMEIGGYFAPALNTIHQRFADRVIGFVEDTQNGHKRYEAARPLPYPVISVARSTLKEGEDTLVGPACYFSSDKLMRQLGVLLSPRRALVVGYGKVGRGTAHALSKNYCPTTVYDINPIRNCVAQGDGMLIPNREDALRMADVIFGCTGVKSVGGNDFELLNDGCFLISCSSKNIEFDLPTLNGTGFQKTNLIVNADLYVSQKSGKRIFLLGGGTPINFIDGAVFGPALSLVPAERILASHGIHSQPASGELSEIAVDERKSIADIWQQRFIDGQSGAFPFF
jgi:adenosylhomocysteinase